MANILVIDDTQLTHRLLDLILARNDHTIISAFNGLEGLELMRKYHVDMVIVDIHMPDMDGFAFIRKVQADTQFEDTPIAVLTASADPNMAELATEVGAFAFLSQPFSSWEISDLVSSCIS